MPKVSWGDTPKRRAKFLLEVLLFSSEDKKKEQKVECQWCGEENEYLLFVKAELIHLERLLTTYSEENNKKESIQSFQKNEQFDKEKIRQAINQMIEIKIVEDKRNTSERNDKKGGVLLWEFNLKLWYGESKKDQNLGKFCEYWDEKKPAKKTAPKTYNNQSTNENTDTNKIYRAAELLRSFDCREQEKSIIDELENNCRGFFIIQAHTSMQKWFIWRLTKCMGDFDKIKKIQIKLNPILLSDVNNIWGEIGKYIGLTSNINRQSLAEKLIDYSKRQAIIIVIDKFEYFNKQKTQYNHLNQFLDSWSDIFKQFQHIDRTKDEPFALFLVENEVITQNEGKIEPYIFNLTRIPESQRKFNSWEQEHRKKLKKQFNWSKDLKSEIRFNEEPYSLVQEICSNVFKLDIDGEIKQYWQIK